MTKPGRSGFLFFSFEFGRPKSVVYYDDKAGVFVRKGLGSSWGLVRTMAVTVLSQNGGLPQKSAISVNARGAPEWQIVSHLLTIGGKRMSRNAFTAALAISIVAYVMAVPSTVAGTTVYKCVKDGQITLTDKPCPSEKGNTDSSTGQLTATVVPSSKDPSPVGKWSGQIQYQEASNGQTVQAAHSVALLTAEFTADGKIMGFSPENGCRLLGVWSAGGQTLNWIDLTLSDCNYSELNRRYHGSVILARPDSSGNLQLQSIGAPFSKDTAKVFDVKGTLRR